jgi:hypothetical protein
MWRLVLQEVVADIKLASQREKDMTDNNEQLSNLSPDTLPSRGSKPTTVSQPQPNNRERLLIFLAALDASPIALRRDLHRDEGRKGDYSIQSVVTSTSTARASYCASRPRTNETSRRAAGPALSVGSHSVASRKTETRRGVCISIGRRRQPRPV